MTDEYDNPPDFPEFTQDEEIFFLHNEHRMCTCEVCNKVRRSLK